MSLLCFKQSRPFGVALLFGGVDEKGPQLYVKIIVYYFKIEGIFACFA